MPSLVARLPAAVRQVCAVLWKAGHEAYVVGGGVRDLLRGEEERIADWDVATSAVPDQVTALFPRVVPTGLAHGTVTVVGEGWTVEVTTYRAEGTYSDGRRPDQVVFLRRLEDDLARRDFTINAVALDPRDGGVVDPFGGEHDLRAGLIRAVGEPRARFAEDGLRPLRAVRFAAVLDFTIESGTLAAIPATLDVFRRVAGERVLVELSKLLGARRPSAGLEPMTRSGLLEIVLPGLARAPEAVRVRAFARADAVARHDWRIRLAALHTEVGVAAVRAALEPLRPASRDVAEVVGLVEALPALIDAPANGPGVRRALSAIGRLRAASALDLGGAHLSVGPLPESSQARLSRNLELAAEALEAEAPLEVGDLALDGAQVQSLLGEPPGPRIGEALRALLDAVLERPELNEPGSLRALLRSQSRDP